MQTSVLQSMLHRNSAAIFNLECEIRREKAYIACYKITGTHKDYFDFRYSRLEKMARELKALVKIQWALKREISGNVKSAAIRREQIKEWFGVLS